MTHWFREPKRIKLMEHLERAGIDFVLCSERFTDEDLLNFKARLQPSTLSERLTLGPPTMGGRQKVLITARNDHPDPEWFRNPEAWAGIFFLPSHRPYMENALHSLFMTNCAFQNGRRGNRAISKGVLNRFVLDLRNQPPTLVGMRETPDRFGQSD
jgi:hypothetical protein